MCEGKKESFPRNRRVSSTVRWKFEASVFSSVLLSALDQELGYTIGRYSVRAFPKQIACVLEIFNSVHAMSA